MVLGNPRPIELLILFFLIGLLIDNLFKKRRQIIFAGLIVCSFFICKNPVYPSITAVDIGQGDSIFLQDKFNKKTILIDTGGRLGKIRLIIQLAGDSLKPKDNVRVN
ncbi:hypothetical protein ACI3SI_19395, partial [Lactococcus lactis]